MLLFHRSCLALLGTQWKFFRKLPPTFSRESRTAAEILLQVSDFAIILLSFCGFRPQIKASFQQSSDFCDVECCFLLYRNALVCSHDHLTLFLTLVSGLEFIRFDLELVWLFIDFFSTVCPRPDVSHTGHITFTQLSAKQLTSTSCLKDEKAYH